MEQDTSKRVDTLVESLHNIEETGLYDVDKYWCNLLHQTGQIEYFYCHLVRDSDKDANDTYYPIYRKPRKNTLAYFNIGRGFPKELHDGHYCFILKDLGYKAIVIPTTSIKEDSQELNPEFELDIDIIKNKKPDVSRLQLSDIRCIDYQRLDTRKPFLKIVTDRNVILDFVKERLFNEV